MNSETWTSANGRTYTVDRDEATPPRVQEALRARGFDGWCYNATSRPVGRQRKTKYALLYRTTRGVFAIAAHG